MAVNVTTSVDKWEDLPAGKWLQTDERGIHWYLDHEGNHWYSDENGYHLYRPEDNEPTESSPEEHSLSPSIEDKPGFEEPKPFPLKLSAGILFVLILGSIIGYVVYERTTEPIFYDEVYWYDSGRGFIFETDQMKIVFPLNNDGCAEWSDEFQTFTEENNLCVARMQVSGYSSEYEGGGVYRICYDTFGANSCMDVHVFDTGIAVNSQNTCQIFLNDIEPSTIDSQSMYMYSQIIINGRIRFDIEDAWTTEFLQKSGEVYAEAKSIDCLFEQFEYDGPRVIFALEDHNEQMTEAVNDSLAIVTAEQVEYSVEYHDIELYVFSESGQLECDIVEMIETGSGWVESETSEAQCIGQLYNVDNSNEYLPALSTGDQIIFQENGSQICNGPCEVQLEIHHHGEIIYTKLEQFE